MPVVKFKAIQKKTVTAGTAVALSATPILARALVIKALPGNTDTVYVGAQGAASATTGFPLKADGAPLDYSQVLGLKPDDAIDLSKIYVDSAVNAEGIAVSYLEL